MNNYFKSNLKFFREQKGLSKNKLGELTGVNQTTISRWENGIISPSIDNVIDLMNALNLPINELGNFLGRDYSNQNNKLILPNSNKEYKEILKEKGLIDENVTEDDAKKLIDFAIANKDFIIKKKNEKE